MITEHTIFMLFTSNGEPWLKDWDKQWDSVESAAMALWEVDSDKRRQYGVHMRQCTIRVGPAVACVAAVTEPPHARSESQ